MWARADAVHYFTDEDNVASLQMHAAFGFEEIARLPTILGAQANREHLVLFRATRPENQRGVVANDVRPRGPADAEQSRS